MIEGTGKTKQCLPDSKIQENAAHGFHEVFYAMNAIKPNIVANRYRGRPNTKSIVRTLETVEFPAEAFSALLKSPFQSL